MVIKFCANISFMFAESGNLLERYQLAKRVGFRGVESAFPAGFTFDEVVAAKREANIAQVLLNTCNGMCKIDNITRGKDLNQTFCTDDYDPQKTLLEENSEVQLCQANRMSLKETSRGHLNWPLP